MYVLCGIHWIGLDYIVYSMLFLLVSLCDSVRKKETKKDKINQWQALAQDRSDTPSQSNIVGEKTRVVKRSALATINFS